MSMKQWLCIVAASALCGPAAAGDIYRCTGGDTVLYTDRPCSDGSTPIVSQPEPQTAAPGTGSGPQTDNSTNVDIQVNNNISLPETRPAAAAGIRRRGLEFRDYRRLERGLSEGEVRAIAGPPDRVVVDAVNTDLGLRKKSYYYVSEGYNANVTRIRFTNGTVTDLERRLRPY